MLHTTPRTAIAALTLTALTVIAGPVSADPDDSRVVVRVYDAGAGGRTVRAAAIRTAAAIVEHAGIAIDWYDCTERSGEPQCQDSRRSHNFIVRLMPTYVAGTAPRLALESLNTTAAVESELGFAVIDPQTLIGAMATIFHDRVLTAARRVGVERSELLGRALAHEVGHLLLQATGHSASGLMRAVWTDEELLQNHGADWEFAAADRRRLQLTVRPSSVETSHRPGAREERRDSSGTSD
jgi:hypothetical protein